MGLDVHPPVELLDRDRKIRRVEQHDPPPPHEAERRLLEARRDPVEVILGRVAFVVGEGDQLAGCGRPVAVPRPAEPRPLLRDHGEGMRLRMSVLAKQVVSRIPAPLFTTTSSHAGAPESRAKQTKEARS